MPRREVPDEPEDLDLAADDVVVGRAVSAAPAGGNFDIFIDGNSRVGYDTHWVIAGTRSEYVDWVAEQRRIGNHPRSRYITELTLRGVSMPPGCQVVQVGTCQQRPDYQAIMDAIQQLRQRRDSQLVMPLGGDEIDVRPLHTNAEDRPVITPWVTTSWFRPSLNDFETIRQAVYGEPMPAPVQCNAYVDDESGYRYHCRLRRGHVRYGSNNVPLSRGDTISISDSDRMHVSDPLEYDPSQARRSRLMTWDDSTPRSGNDSYVDSRNQGSDAAQERQIRQLERAVEVWTARCRQARQRLDEIVTAEQRYTLEERTRAQHAAAALRDHTVIWHEVQHPEHWHLINTNDASVYSWQPGTGFTPIAAEPEEDDDDDDTPIVPQRNISVPTRRAGSGTPGTPRRRTR